MGDLMTELEKLLAECEKWGLKVSMPEKIPMYKAIMRYNRGLGPEYITLKPITAATVQEAQEQADSQAQERIKTFGKKAFVSEVRITPCENF